MNALTGKGLQVDRSRLRRSVDVYAPKIPRIQNQSTSTTGTTGGLVLPMNHMSPPFIGTWGNQIGLGVKPKKKAKKKNGKKKKASGKGLLLGKNSPFNNIPLIGSIL